MRACFMGKYVFGLGNGIAVLQSLPRVIENPKPRLPKPAIKPGRGKAVSGKSDLAEKPVKPVR
jgi:hypothetical protein